MPSKMQEQRQRAAASASSALDAIFDRTQDTASIADRRHAERARMRRERAAALAAEGDAIVAARAQAEAAEQAAEQAPERREAKLREHLRDVIRSVW